jgi:hypothetical protein
MGFSERTSFMRAAGWMDAARDLPSDIADELECGQYRSFGALGLRAGQTRIEATRRSQRLRFSVNRVARIHQLLLAQGLRQHAFFE